MSSPAYQALGTTWGDHDSRTRLLDATVELAAGRGLQGLTVGAVTAAAGSTRRTFYRYFADLPGAFLAAQLGLHSELRDAVGRAHATSSDPERRAIACVDALVDLVVADRLRAWVLFVEGPAGGTTLDALRTETKEWAIDLLMSGARPPKGDSRPRLLAEMAVGGIEAVVWGCLVRDDADGLEAAKPGLVAAALRPYRAQRRGQRA